MQTEPPLDELFQPRAASPSLENSDNKPQDKKKGIYASEGDSVLIDFLSNFNQPDLVNLVRKEHPLSVSHVEASLAQAGGGSEEEMDRAGPGNADIQPDIAEVAASAIIRIADDHELKSREAHRGLTNGREKPRPTVLTKPGQAARTNADRGAKPEKISRNSNSGDGASQPLGEASQGSRPTSSQLSQQNQLSPTPTAESIATSPALRQFAITASEGSPMETLPAMQTSPSIASRSPTGQQNLPSLASQLGNLKNVPPPPVTTNGTRQTYTNGAIHSPPQEYSSARPHYTYPMYPATEPSPASTNSGVSPREPFPSVHHTRSMSPPAKFGPRQFPTNGLTPQSEVQTPLSASTQASMTTLSTEGSPVHERMVMDPDRPTLPPLLAGGPLISGGFKCEHLGCTAPPFQTQYLLKYVEDTGSNWSISDLITVPTQMYILRIARTTVP